MTPIHETDCAAMRFELELIIQELADIEEAATRLRRRISGLLQSTEGGVSLAPQANIDVTNAASRSDDMLHGHAAPNCAAKPSALTDLPSQSEAANNLAAPQALGHIVKVAETTLEAGETEAARHSSVCYCELPEPNEIVVESSAEDVGLSASNVEVPACAEPIRLIALPVVHSNQAVAIISSRQKPFHRSWVAPFATAASVMLVTILVLWTKSDVVSVFSALARRWA